MENYDHKHIESKWQKIWKKNKSFAADDSSFPRKSASSLRKSAIKPKFYGLIEFPYPSGQGLHVGHIRSNTAMDAISRKRRAEGFNVLYPIGWDAFGLPTENYAIKTGTAPKIVTKKNADVFRKQLKALGFSFDWSREINTTDPAYYKWTQWIFLELYKHGLAYKKKMAINWCPKDKIGLANEEVVDGKCERCGTSVEKREKEQWMLAITKYADRLDKDLDTVDFLPQIKLQQRNWIGRSEGAEIKFKIAGETRSVPKKILVGTRNMAKVKMIRDAFPKNLHVEFISLNDIPPVDDSNLVEGDDFRKNASLKAEFYFKRTGIPTISTDQIQWVQKWPSDNGLIVHIRKLVNPKSSRATDEEVGRWIENFVDKNGNSPATFHYAISYADKFGLSDFVNVQREYLLQKTCSSRKNDGYVFDSYMKDVRTGEFRADQPISVAFDRLVDFMNGEFVESLFGSKEISVFTTRPDTLFGATYLVLSPEHELVKGFLSFPRMRESSLIKNLDEIEKYVTATKKKTEIERTAEEKEKTGVELKGIKAINPANGEVIPIWIADYVLADYGTGAIMAVPAHDERDFAFATRYNIPMKEVVTARTDADFARTYAEKEKHKAYIGEGILTNSGKFDGLTSEEAKNKITEAVGGKIVTTYKLRDWIFSRQRYWGEPIPLVNCENCKKTVETEAHALNFRDQDIWGRLMTGEKTVETRVLNPEEPDRYFGNIKKGEYLKCVNKVTGEVAYFKVSGVKKLKNLEDLLTHPELLAKMKRNYAPTLDELKKGYSYTPDYVERIQKNGLIAFEVERTIPGWVPVPEKDLPVKLPEVKNYQPTDTGESPLAAISKWVNMKCPVCGGPAKRETDTMPNWAGSSWYYLAYCISENLKSKVAISKQISSSKIQNKFKYWSGLSASLQTKNYKLQTSSAPGPVDWYNGGMEHTTLHLLYSRFWHKFLYDCGYVPTSEPYTKRTSHGLILAGDNEKMSKSRGNVINPDEIVARFGADALRVYEMFMGPFDQAIAWNTDGIVGTRRFLEKVWRVACNFPRILADSSRDKQFPISNFQSNPKSQFSNSEKLQVTSYKLQTLLHQTIKKVSEDTETMRFNTAISALMILTNEMEKAEVVSVGDFKILLQLLAPFAPHIAEELWSKFGQTRSVQLAEWPKYDASKLVSDTVKITVQINGKVRAILDAPRDSAQSAIEILAKSDQSVLKWLGSYDIKKVVFVPNRLINFVV